MFYVGQFFDPWAALITDIKGFDKASTNTHLQMSYLLDVLKFKFPPITRWIYMNSLD